MIFPDHMLCLSNSNSKGAIHKEPDWLANMGQEAKTEDNHMSQRTDSSGKKRSQGEERVNMTTRVRGRDQTFKQTLELGHPLSQAKGGHDNTSRERDRTLMSNARARTSMGEHGS